MNREEFLEKYGDHEVEFRSYYKYTFIFLNETLEVHVGGAPNEIHKLEVVSGKKYHVWELYPYAAYVNGILIFLS